MKIRINRDEAWPEYYPEKDERLGREVEVPDGFGKKFRRVAKQWGELQRTLNEAWKAASGQVVHEHPPDGLLTLCCDKRLSELGSEWLTTTDLENVTCKGTG